ncbi:MAG: FecR domain-containing protein [Myxococcales bacterium]|nr:FecR domain-containing protein [Myxococcales bacterium]
MTRGFRQALREADAVWAQSVPGPLATRLDARLRDSLKPRRSLRWGDLGLVGAGAVVGAVLVVALYRPAPRPSAEAAPAQVAGFQVARATPEAPVVAVASDEVRVDEELELYDAARQLRVTASAGTTLKREPRGVRLVKGQGVFRVAKQPQRPEPVRVLVSGGDIEVRGTRFTVTQGADGTGHVTLEEGAIDFRFPSGRVKAVSPGETVHWPEEPEELAPLPELPPPPAKPARPTANWNDFDRRLRSEVVLKRVMALRQQGRWAECLEELERALELPDAAYGPGTRERLSWELGSVLTWPQHHQGAACWHWTIHLKTYPRGRYALEATRAMDALGCTR